MKKMRRLIPAIAMLLVSAVMLSTASFAWFTMNEAVTATGMNIQAQASGSLVIKADAPLTESDTKINIDFLNDADSTAYQDLYSLTPVHYNDGDVATDVSRWEKPATGSVVDMYGVASGDLAPVTVTAGTDYVDYVVYLATGGEAMEGKTLNATITAASNGTLYIAPAYTVAFYVGANATNITAQSKADKVLHLDDTTITADDGCNIGAIVSDLDIPSIVGVTGSGATSAGVGVKVVMRVFVDGDLDNPTPLTYQQAVFTPTASDAKYVEGTTYYTDATGATEVNTTGFVAGTTSVAGYYTKGFETKEAPTKYVNSSKVPVNGTTIKVEFSVD